MPDAGEIALADEQMSLAKDDTTVDQLRSTGDDQQRRHTVPALGAGAGELGILDASWCRWNCRWTLSSKSPLG